MLDQHETFCFVVSVMSAFRAHVNKLHCEFLNKKYKHLISIKSNKLYSTYNIDLWEHAANCYPDLYIKTQH